MQGCIYSVCKKQYAPPSVNIGTRKEEMLKGLKSKDKLKIEGKSLKGKVIEGKTNAKEAKTAIRVRKG